MILEQISEFLLPALQSLQVSVSARDHRTTVHCICRSMLWWHLIPPASLPPHGRLPHGTDYRILLRFSDAQIPDGLPYLLQKKSKDVCMAYDCPLFSKSSGQPTLPLGQHRWQWRYPIHPYGRSVVLLPDIASQSAWWPQYPFSPEASEDLPFSSLCIFYRNAPDLPA